MIDIGPGIPSVPFWVPLIVSFLLTSLLAPAGVSGAFLLLPFQMSFLHFVSPAVTPTNHLFNVVAIPSGVYRYVREKRMLWPLSLVILAGSVPGVVLGALLRVRWLHDVRRFKLLAALILLYICLSMVRRIVRGRRAAPRERKAERTGAIELLRFDRRRLEYRIGDRRHGLSPLALAALALLIGVAGGAYGVGGGALLAPILVASFDFPIHAIAGATLFGTWVTSVVSVLSFAGIGPLLGAREAGAVLPNWTLGLLFGCGGLLGMYTGARLQRRLPASIIEGLLALVAGGWATIYIYAFFQR